MSGPVAVRAFDEEDRAALRALFGRRAGAGSPVAALWGHEESEAAVYLTPYMDREPSSLFVAVVDGTIVGYLAGCLDSSAFPRGERTDRASDPTASGGLARSARGLLRTRRGGHGRIKAPARVDRR